MPSQDPLVGFHFSLEISGTVTGYFSEVSGIGSENEVIENKVIGQDGHKEVIMKIPGRLKWENIVLKRGITASMDMWVWREAIIAGQIESNRKGGIIHMLNHEGAIVATWTFDRGWPVKVTGPSVKSDSNEIGVEEMTIAHEGTRRTL